MLNLLKHHPPENQISSIIDIPGRNPDQLGEYDHGRAEQPVTWKRKAMPIDHMVVEDLRAHFVEDLTRRLILSITALRLRMNREGLQTLASTLLPEHPLEINVDGESTDNHCTVGVQAQQWGFSPRINVKLEPHGITTGSILISLSPNSRWSLADQGMLAVANNNLARLSREQPELQRIESGMFLLDLQRLIRDRLIESAAPVSWNTKLDRISGSGGEIVVEFVPVIVD